MAKKLLRKVETEKGLEEIYGIVLFALSILISLFIFTGSGGLIGKYFAYFLRYAVGMGRYFIPPFLIIGGLLYLIPVLRKNLEIKGLGLLISFIALISLINLITLNYLDLPAASTFEPKFFMNSGGGIIGSTLSYALWFLVRIGAYIVLTTALLVGILLLTGFSLSKAFAGLKNRSLFKERPSKFIPPREGSREEGEVPLIFETQKLESPPDLATEEKGKPTTPALKEPSASATSFQLPPLEFLKRSQPSRDLSSKKGVREGIHILEEVLANFNVDGRVKKVVQGPTVTRFELTLSPGVKVNRLLNLADDIALVLASPDVRILTPIPGKPAVGIEVPNKYRELVTLGDILGNPLTKEKKGVLIIGLGKDIAGQPVLADLGEMPHLLIAGATGSGKSVCINAILTSILARAHPEAVKMILIDPKRIEFNFFNDIPHLLTPVVISPKQSATVLAWAVEEMESRFQTLAEAGTRNIDSYHKKFQKDQANGFKSLPYILIVIDELADLMMVAPSEVEDAICRLAQLARAVGIHLVVATQRPSTDIITGLIKANITSRIAFAVSSQTDSRVILDTGGAEKLVGKGDMLFITAASLKPRRIQGAFVSEQEVSKITEFLKKQAKPVYSPEIFEKERSKLSAAALEDELLDEAMALVVNTGYASVSLLQRRLRVGYTRAARLIDILEEKGVVSGYDGSRPRVVLITKEEFEKIKESPEG